MIPRKLAKRLLAEYVERLRNANADALEREGTVEAVEPDEIAAALLDESDLVLRGAENVEQKARRYLMEGRLVVERIERSGLIVASCRGSSGETYHLGYDPTKNEWRCTCPVLGKRNRCSHLAALQLVVQRP